MKSLLFLLAAVPLFSAAVPIKGRITDEKNLPLPYATIYLKNTNIGTTANDEGYYSMDAPYGEYEIVFQYIGYKKVMLSVRVEQHPVTLNVSLQIETLELSEVVVDASGEDPAYEIIRHAQKVRKHFLKQVSAYSCKVYIKNIQELDSIPQKIFGIKAKKMNVDSTKMGILYLSESESQYNFSKPDKVKEIVYSSKVSGNNNAFTWNSASIFSADFYENIIPLEGISSRGLVSPIADGAFTFYRYKLLGTFYEDGLLINKIQVIAKRPTDPAFNGIIYIVENQWRIHSLDLLVTKEAHLDFVDSLRFTQTYGRVNDSVWMPFNQLLNFRVKVLGFNVRGELIGVCSGYDVSPDFPPDFFDAETLKINADANQKDSTYWQEIRPVPLTLTEKTDYHRKDSIYVLHHSKAWLDSVDREENKFHVQDLFLGYTYENSFNKISYKWENPLLGVSYNTVEGFNLTLRNSLSKKFGEQALKSWDLKGDIRYGFSNHKLGAQVIFRYNDDRIHDQYWTAGLGIFPNQINKDQPISELVNALYTLIAQQNLMKLYERRFASFQHEREWLNGFDLKTTLYYADRWPLENSTDYSFDWVGNNSFEPNNYFDNLHADSLVRTQEFIVDLSADITFGKKYITRPNGRFSAGSKFPTFTLHYRKGLEVFGSDINFDLIEAGMNHDFSFGLVGSSRLNFSGGTFLNNRATTIIDFMHFLGNQTIIGAHYNNGFQLLPYYTYSTNQDWLQVHYEHHFGGFIFNKIPLIKNLSLQEVAGGHFLLTGDVTYFELDAGIEHIFKFFRIDFITSFGANGTQTGFLVGLDFLGGSISVD